MGSAFGRVGAVIGVFALVSGCSGGGGSGRSLPLEQFGTKFIAAYCHKLLSCCSSAQLAAINPTIVDQASCEASLVPSPQSDLALAPGLVDAGVVTYHADTAQGCLNELAAFPCGGAGQSALSQCGRVFQGTLTAGSPCGVSLECASDYCTNAPSGGIACAAPVGLGESCEFAPCSSGLSCVSSPSSGQPRTCGQPFPDGSGCMYDADCAGGACVMDASTGLATCGPLSICRL
jgi:hypothetical protein